MPWCMKHLERVARCLERLSILQKHIRFQMQTAALKLDGQVLIRTAKTACSCSQA